MLATAASPKTRNVPSHTPTQIASPFGTTPTSSSHLGPESYELISVIGSGSFGKICKVRRVTDGVIMARKEINFVRMNDRERHQLVQEVNILRELNHHQHIVRYYSRYIDHDNDVIFILMEFCEGGDLSCLIKQTRKQGQFIPEHRVWIIYSQLVAALHECHHKGFRSENGSVCSVLHRDIKPENVFLDKHDNVKLGDFGLSTQMENRERAFASTYVGTPFYMSPELVQEKSYNNKSDIWSLGCLIYELCALQPPFQGQSHRQLNQKILAVYYPPISKAHYSDSISNTIARLLKRRPEERPSAKDLYEDPTVQVILRTKNRLDAKLIQVSNQESQLNARQTNLQQLEADVSARQELVSSHERALMDQKKLLELEAAKLARDRHELEMTIKNMEAAKLEHERKEHNLTKLENQLLTLQQSSKVNNRNFCPPSTNKSSPCLHLSPLSSTNHNGLRDFAFAATHAANSCSSTQSIGCPVSLRHSNSVSHASRSFHPSMICTPPSVVTPQASLSPLHNTTCTPMSGQESDAQLRRKRPYPDAYPPDIPASAPSPETPGHPNSDFITNMAGLAINSPVRQNTNPRVASKLTVAFSPRDVTMADATGIAGSRTTPTHLSVWSSHTHNIMHHTPTPTARTRAPRHNNKIMDFTHPSLTPQLI